MDEHKIEENLFKIIFRSYQNHTRNNISKEKNNCKKKIGKLGTVD